MNRREMLIALAALAATPFVARAQKAFRIGLAAHQVSPEARARLQVAFRKHGWTEGRDYELVLSDIAPNPRLEEVGSVMAKRPDLLVTYSTVQALEAQRRSATLPVVMFFSGYPVQVGVADSIARPGRNVTGNTSYVNRDIWGKLAQLLVEVKPEIKSIGLLWDYWPGKGLEPDLKDLEKILANVETTLRVRIRRMDITSSGEIATALAAMDAAGAQALILTGGPFLGPAREQVLQYAVSRRMPTIVEGEVIPEYQGLRPTLSYGPSLASQREQAVEYVVRILRDRAKPGELPIRLPARFELLIYRESAARIGLSIPESLSARADRIIE